MSFYGSVYYQLLDAFNKIILQNSGSKKIEFNKNILTEPNIAQAVGRKSSFSLDTGNRWITFSAEESGKKADDDENSSIVYKIWHSLPDTNSKNCTDIGFEKVDFATEPKDYVQLKENDYFYAYQHKIDAAGHVDPKSENKILYRLPKSEISDRTSALEEYVGTPAKTLPHDGIENLFDYAEKAYDNIETQQSYIGDWTKVANSWSHFKPTVQSTIGDMDELFGDKIYKDYKNQNLVSILGDQTELWKKFNKENPISISEILVNQNDELVEMDKTLQNQINGIYTSIGTPIDQNQVYDHIEELHDDIERIDGIINKPTDENRAVYTYLNELDGNTKNISAIVEANKEACDANIAKVEANYAAADLALESAYKKADSNLEAGYKAADTALETKINAKIGSFSENETIKEYIDAVSENIRSAINRIENECENSDSALEEQIQGVITDYKKADTALENKINAKIGTFSEDNTVKGYIDNISDIHSGDIARINQEIGSLKTVDENINSKIGNIPNDLTVKAYIDNQDGALDTSLRNLIMQQMSIIIDDTELINQSIPIAVEKSHLNVEIFGNDAVLTNLGADTCINFNLNQPLEADTDYSFFFSCDGLAEDIEIPFKISIGNNKYHYFNIKNGRNLVTFKRLTGFTSLFIDNEGTVDGNYKDSSGFDPILYDFHLYKGIAPKNFARSKKYPTLTGRQKQEIHKLMTEYYNLGKSGSDDIDHFVYEYNIMMNGYASTRCWSDTSKKYRLCCSTFCELVWMGRPASSFDLSHKTITVNPVTGQTLSTPVTVPTNYSPTFSPSFNWGYSWKEDRRKSLAGVVRRVAETTPGGNTISASNLRYYRGDLSWTKIDGFFNLVKPLTDSYKYSYSTTTTWGGSGSSYDTDNVVGTQQMPLAFEMASDFARELYDNGYEIPFSELNIGDVIFNTSSKPRKDEAAEMKAAGRWKEITHASMVYNKVGNVITIIQCSDVLDTDTYGEEGSGKSIYKCSFDSTDAWSLCQSEKLQKHITMCARHPGAWGHSNMKLDENNEYTIKATAAAQQDGLSGNTAIELHKDENGNIIGGKYRGSSSTSYVNSKVIKGREYFCDNRRYKCIADGDLSTDAFEDLFYPEVDGIHTW